jgi:predicted CXXCH cytochrome family protein
MKTLKTVMISFIICVFSQSGFGQISGSEHDFSAELWNTSGEMCIVCHAPHNADVSIADAPLWNHQITTQVFTLYTSSTFDGVAGQPDASSKLCLSCHDGVTAVDNFGGETAGTEFITGARNIDVDLSDDHPVSFTYNTALATADGGLKDPATDPSGLGGTINADMLIGGKMQCASCHDVHNTAGEAHLLRLSNASSALCLTCHIK